jgi:hypothetical protein
MPSEAHNFGEEEGSVMLATRNLVWLGFMLLLVSAMLTPQMAAALEVAPAASQATWGQPLLDSTLKDVSGKDSSITLSGFGNNEQNVWYQINQPGTNKQTNSASITINGVSLLDSTQVGAQGSPLPAPSSAGYYKSGQLDPNAFGTLMGLFTRPLK